MPRIDDSTHWTSFGVWTHVSAECGDPPIRAWSRRQLAVMQVAGMIVASILTAPPMLDAQVAVSPLKT